MMEYGRTIITLVGVIDTAIPFLEKIGGVVVRSPLDTKDWNDVQFKVHKLRMTVDGISIRNIITREYARIPYEWIHSIDIR